MEVKEIIELMKAMSENGMTGFELEEGDWKLSTLWAFSFSVISFILTESSLIVNKGCQKSR